MSDNTMPGQSSHEQTSGVAAGAHEAAAPHAPQPPASNALATFGDSGQQGSQSGPTEAFIGDMTVTRDSIRSPQGVIPAQGAQIFVNNRTRYENAIPTWAIVVAIVGFFVITIFSLFFLLVKEQRFAGGYEVVATGPNGTLTSFIPVNQQSAGYIWNDLQARAAHARAVIDAA